MPELSIEYMRMCASNEGWSREVEGSGGRKYTVTFGRVFGQEHDHGYSCTCPAFRFGKGKPCKHVAAVRGERCGWHQQFDGGRAGDGKCPRCGGETVVIRVGV